MNNYAYITLLSTNNYLYGCLGLYYSWKATNPKYPFYVIVTPEITEENKTVLKNLGYQIIEDELYIPKAYYKLLQDIEQGKQFLPYGNSTADLTKNGWQYGWTKLHIWKYTQFDKLLYLDADSVVIQNMDYLFDLPELSLIPEHNTNCSRFLSAFLLIQPNKYEYENLLHFAEAHPIITHPFTGQAQLANDFDLLNLYFNHWSYKPELHLPEYTYVDSILFQEHKENVLYWINNFHKIKAIHLSDKKPWLYGYNFMRTQGDAWDMWRKLYQWYVVYLNHCLENYNSKNNSNLQLVKE